MNKENEAIKQEVFKERRIKQLKQRIAYAKKSLENHSSDGYKADDTYALYKLEKELEELTAQQ